jgi:predicted permease
LLNPSPNVAKQRFSMLGHILLPCLVITIGLMIAIKKKRSTENDINQQGPKNLDSFWLNSLLVGLAIYFLFSKHYLER